MGLTHNVSNLRQATVLLGLEGIRRWVTLVSLQTFSEDKPPELFTISLLRAKFCELIASELKHPNVTPDTGFLLGMFSLIDALLNQPMEEVLEEVALSEELTSALLGEKSDLRKILDIAVAYEQGDWDQVIALCKEENLSPGRLKQNYNAALEWYNLLQSVG